MRMDQNVQQKLFGLGYDSTKSEEASYGNLIALSRGFLGGLVFFEGAVLFRDKGRVLIHDEEGVIITGSRTQNSHSLYGDILQRTLEKDTVIDPQSGHFSSLYVSPLNKRFKEEGVCLDFITPHDRIYVSGIRKDLFTLIFEDIRKICLATFEFHKHKEMLYIPKRSNS